MKDHYAIIDKVLSGKASDADQEELARWIGADPSNAEEFDDLKLLYEASIAVETSGAECEIDQEEGYRMIVKRVEKVKRFRKRLHAGKVLGMAVMISCAVFTAFLVVRNSVDMRGNTHADVLVFNDASFAEVITALERRYDVELRIHSKEILEERITGTFSGTVGINEVLNILAESEGFDYVSADHGFYDLHKSGVFPHAAGSQKE